jgi:hypothetical protein
MFIVGEVGDGPSMRDQVVRNNVVQTLMQMWPVVHGDCASTKQDFLEKRILIWLIANICRGVNPSPPWDYVRLVPSGMEL